MALTFPNESPDYRAARDRLLEREIELRREMESLAEARRALPPGGLVPQDYVFDGEGANGAAVKVTLSSLFAPRKDALAIYNFMFPRYSRDDRPAPETGETAKLKRAEGPCPSCVAQLDQLDGAASHMEAAGLNFVVIAKTPLARVLTFARERGWRNMRFLSSADNSFKRDYHAETEDGEQMPTMTVFQRTADGIRHFWTSELLYSPPDAGQDPRHLGTIEPLWTMLDLTPAGRPPKWDEQLQYGCCCA
jgi:predicted dithiol-disulfide oxidoreductase (DUF899 family)